VVLQFFDGAEDHHVGEQAFARWTLGDARHLCGPVQTRLHRRA
jgi:hypothetical protein